MPAEPHPSPPKNISRPEHHHAVGQMKNSRGGIEERNSSSHENVDRKSHEPVGNYLKKDGHDTEIILYKKGGREARLSYSQREMLRRI